MNIHVFSLHKYWIWANRMREHFDKAINQKSQDEINNSPETWLISDSNIFMSYWYSGLYVVIEGWRELKLQDQEIDKLLESPHVQELKRYRHGVCHFQRKYFDQRFKELMRDSESSVEWVRKLNKSFGRYFLQAYQSAKEDI